MFIYTCARNVLITDSCPYAFRWIPTRNLAEKYQPNNLVLLCIVIFTTLKEFYPRVKYTHSTHIHTFSLSLLLPRTPSFTLSLCFPRGNPLDDVFRAVDVVPTLFALSSSSLSSRSILLHEPSFSIAQMEFISSSLTPVPCRLRVSLASLSIFLRSFTAGLSCFHLGRSHVHHVLRRQRRRRR